MITPEEETLAQLLEIYRKKVTGLKSLLDQARNAEQNAVDDEKRQREHNERRGAQLAEAHRKVDKLRAANNSLHLELQAEREAHQKLKDQTKGES